MHHPPLVVRALRPNSTHTPTHLVHNVEALLARDVAEDAAGLLAVDELVLEWAVSLAEAGQKLHVLVREGEEVGR